MKRRQIILCSFLMLLGFTLSAQDLHFSQYYNSPLALNPALTGRMKEDVRVALIHRRQWRQINSPFTTSAIGGDINFRTGVDKKDKIGAGLILLNDELGDGVFKNQSILLSGAYHKILDEKMRHRLSLGLQGGYMRKNISTNGFLFRDQIVNYQASNVASAEPAIANGFGYININAGAYWSFIVSPKMEVYSGISLFNLTKPKESIFSGSFPDPTKLSRRFVYSGGFTYKLGEKYSVSPSILYMRHAKSTDMIVGAGLGYAPTKALSLQAGAFYRYSDAFIIMAGMKIKNYQLGFSYDATSSSLTQVKTAPNVNPSAKVGAIEISLIYTGWLPRAMPRNTTIPCGIF